MADQTFEYCSLYYLNQWLSYDYWYCQALSEGSEKEKLATLKRAAVFYRVARNLPTEFDVGIGVKRYKPLLKILDEVEHSHFKVNPFKNILKIERKISEKYGNKNLLSLTTKFLWLKIKHPILIYDSQARIAVGTENGDLEAYYEEWQANFDKYKNQIKIACLKLSKLNLYAADQEIGTEKYIKNISSKLWFHERVFDIYLWNIGDG